MKYIVHRRFQAQAICGNVNLPALTECECKNGTIMLGDKKLCAITSENAHQYFAINDDGQGMERGSLTQNIVKKLSKRDNDYQSRWDKVWGDVICQKYKRKEHKDFWLWNHDFFNANMYDLHHIARLVGVID